MKMTYVLKKACTPGMKSISLRWDIFLMQTRCENYLIQVRCLTPYKQPLT